MKKNPSSQTYARDTAFTLVELLVVIFIVTILAALVIPNVGPGCFANGHMTGTLNNERQLQLATQQMALDSTTTTNRTIGWPGDVSNTTVQALVSNLVPTYMLTNDILKLFQAPGVAPISSLSAISGTTIPYFIFPVRATNPGDTIFIVTRNWGGFASPLLDVAPYHQKGVVVFHMGGDGEIFGQKQASATTTTNGGMMGETNGFPPLQ